MIMTKAMKQNNTAAVSSNESSKLLLLCGDLIREILLKLPIKTLLRFKQVSKTWLRMITSSSFISDHYSVAKSRQSGTPSFFIVRIPINICDRDRVVSVITQISMEASSIRINKNIPLRSQSRSQTCRVEGYPYPIMFTAGFGLYCAFESLSQRVALLNPGTRNSELLPVSPFCDRIHSDNLFCFGHVEYKEEDGGFSYKVGLLSQRQVENNNSVLVHRLQLYSSTTDSWKLILTPEGSCCSWMANGVNLNGKYHILSYGYESSDDDEDDYAYYEYDCHIMTFDYSSEVFGRIELPDLLGKAAGRSSLMIDSFLTLDDDIFLCLVVRWKNKQAVSDDDEDEQVSDDELLDEEEVNHEEFLDVWVMREYGVKKSWSKELTVGPISRGIRMLGYWKSAGGFFLEDHYKLYICNGASFEIERLDYVDLDEMHNIQVVQRTVESLIPIKRSHTGLK